MKIFNWVQKRFNHTILKDGLARNVKKTDGIAIDTNTKALLEQVALVDVLDGILTIGTFGFDPLKPSSGEQNDYFASESSDKQEEERYSDDNIVDDVDYDNSDEEVNPLVFSSFDHGFEDETMRVHGAADQGCTDHEIKYEEGAIEGHSGKLRRRTTLADLFSEESDSGMNKKPNTPELDSNSCKKATVRTKHGLPFAKKLMPQVGEDSRPIKMLNKMMKRMLKRKIHPELEGKGNKLNGQCSMKHEAGETVYLLQSPGAATPTA